MNSTLCPQLSRRWFEVQNELVPLLRSEYEGLTPRLEQVIRTLEWVRVEEYITVPWYKFGGRPARERCDLARAFVVKAVLGFETTRQLIERLAVDTCLRRICGFDMRKRLPSEATFSRAFAEFAKDELPQKVHAIMVREQLGDQLIGHISRDSTAIPARETPKPAATSVAPKELSVATSIEALGQTSAAQARNLGEGTCAQKDACEANPSGVPSATPAAPTADAKPKARRGRPRKGEQREVPAQASGKVALQLNQTLSQVLSALPTLCDWGTKKNSEGHKETWKGYKLHLDTTDCAVPVAALISSASMHDSLAAIPMATITAQRVTSFYDLMDAAYCCEAIRAHSRSLGHVPLIDHNPRKGEKKEFLPHEAQRYKERSQAERMNARLKDEFGAGQVWVRGHEKVSCHLMFCVLALAADQLMRLLR